MLAVPLQPSAAILLAAASQGGLRGSLGILDGRQGGGGGAAGASLEATVSQGVVLMQQVVVWGCHVGRLRVLTPHPRVSSRHRCCRR
ncbi:hypothetical protein Pmani_000762 [Petrolisthes manimaculis]|uniref:Uncharacterized protein n=1 Tax=Petrolisthes manimaculis TaxID=1843537 RepID=A0AAE1QLB5_9EUCA|nr:hypothetical protein Pmani_000762 [Petrolisthes manimaculis]